MLILISIKTGLNLPQQETNFNHAQPEYIAQDDTVTRINGLILICIVGDIIYCF